MRTLPPDGMDEPRSQGWVGIALALAGRAAAAACGVLAVALVALVLWRSAGLLALLYAAAILAVLLERPVAWLERAGLGRSWALALVLIGVFAVTIAAAVVAVGPLVAQARELASAAPAVAERVRSAGRFGGNLDATPLAAWVHEAASRGATALGGGVYSAAGGAANAAGALATMLVMSVVLLASGPRVVERAIEALPPGQRPWGAALARDLSVSLGGYLAGLGTIVLARIVATSAFLAIARVPFVAPLAVLAGASVLIPYLGSVLRLLAIGAVAWEARGSGTAVAALAFVVVYDVVENYVISPIVYRKALGISALAQLVAVLFLGYHFGVAGAVLAIPLVATVQIVARATRSRASNASRSTVQPEDREARVVPHQPPREAPAGGRSGE